MPIPRLSATHHRNSARARAFQLNTNKATTAPMWNRARNNVMVRLRGWAKVRSRLRILVTRLLEADSRLEHSSFERTWERTSGKSCTRVRSERKVFGVEHRNNSSGAVRRRYVERFLHHGQYCSLEEISTRRHGENGNPRQSG